jgi:signal transduction histidine kinase
MSASWRRWLRPGASFRRVFLIQLVAMLVGWTVWIVHFWSQYTHVAGPEVGSLRSDLGDVAQRLADGAALTADAAAVPAVLVQRLNELDVGYQEMLRLKTPAFGYVLWSAQGRVVLEQQAKAVWWQGLPPQPETDERRMGRELNDAQGQAWFAIRRPSADGRYVAAAAVQREALDELLYVLLRATLVPTLWILPFMLPTTLLIAWVATRPVRRLARHIGQREADDLSEVPEHASDAELAPVVRAVNRWMQALRQARATQALVRERERTFFANAAHELRTPLAALGAYAHALEHSEQTTTSAEAVQGLRMSVQRMSALLDKLLLLARLDAQTHSQAPVRIDLAQRLRERVAAFAPLALRRRIDLSLDAPAAGAVISGHEENLLAVVDNLLDNALRYTPDGGRIEVSLQGSAASGWRLQVADDGPGIEPALRERVFERFYRAPGVTAPGTGLGLSIVRESVNTMGAQVLLGEGLGGRGLGVQVQWPTEMSQSVKQPEA